MVDGIRIAADSKRGKYYTVRVHFSPVSIIILDETKHLFVFGAKLFLSWQASCLKWDESEYDGIDTVYVSNFPIPNTAIANGVGTLKLDKNIDVRLSSDGSCEADYLETFTTSCNVDPSLFPFDEQVCELVLISDGSFTLVADEEVGIKHEVFTNSSEWEVLKVTAETREYESHGIQLASAVFKFHLKRQSTFHVITVLFPMALLSFMNTFAFLLPYASGEKMSYLVSIFVSYAMFLNFIYDSMPQSGTVTRMAIYLVLILLQSGLAILFTIILFGIRLNSKGQKERFVRKVEIILFGLFFIVASLSLLVFF
ncbi:neuronal acetylcholine receptor subunit alpha-10-like [Gigantopelta aegis]|uniref:neuronal acetylcholine receptor subunit alpha-10-like n=1 Tax=Gigantopelta aegis TaxID=1735272 RepID=UPI001B88DBEF|nr:neuronal acetylcholine receptor subunit alpha-10-like [Gigantopelta aegis]